MKTIVVIRHAKAESQASSGEDFDRKLLRKGKIEVEVLVQRFIRRLIAPSIIVTSPVIRARSTAQILADEFQLNDKLVVRNFLYNRLYSFSDIENVIVENQCDGDVVFVVGHHPTILHLILQMIGVKIEFLDTSEAVVAQFDTDQWLGVSSLKATRFEVLSRS
jgi:phosphohistidine phosphatase